MTRRFEHVVHHREQSQRNYCVVACTSMVLSRLGQEMPQDAIRATWFETPHGFALRDAADFLRERAEVQVVDPPWKNPATFEQMRIQLQHSHWILPYVHAQVLADVMQAMTPEPGSRFGPMAGGLHAVVLVGADDERFYYLDPYYPAAGQPFALSNEDFAVAFQDSAFAVRVG